MSWKNWIWRRSDSRSIDGLVMCVMDAGAEGGTLWGEPPQVLLSAA